MDTLQLGALGVALDRDQFELAATAELVGYGTLWIAGGQLDTLAPLTDLIGRTSSARVAPAIIPVDHYPAREVAALFHDLETTAPGRFVVGVGGPQSAQPLAGLHRWLDDLDHVGVPVERRLLAALGPRKLAVARERAAGAITLLVTPEHTAGARAALGPDRTLVVDILVVLDPDPARARAVAREPLGFLTQVAGYRTNLQRQRFSDDEIDGLADRLVDALVPHGTPDEIAERLAQHRAAGADHLMISPLTTDATPDLATTLTDLSRALAR